MLHSRIHRIGLFAAMAAILVAAPADAQGKGKGQAKKEVKEVRERPELIRRDQVNPTGTRLDDIFRSESRDARKGPPFCRNGQGHPVHGRQWCADKGFGMGAGGVVLGRRDSRDPYGGYGSGSYEQAHAEFHRWHDRECRLAAAERPLDVEWQLRVRTLCKQRHDEWHAQAGRRH